MKLGRSTSNMRNTSKFGRSATTLLSQRPEDYDMSHLFDFYPIEYEDIDEFDDTFTGGLGVPVDRRAKSQLKKRKTFRESVFEKTTSVFRASKFQGREGVSVFDHDFTKRGYQAQNDEVGTFIIHPFSTFRTIWVFTTSIVLAANIMFLFPSIAFPKFDRNYLMVNPTAWYPVFAFYFKMITDVWFLVDLMLNFRTGWVTDDGKIILHVGKVRRLYLRFWFWIDLISIIPFDTVVEFAQLEKTNNLDAIVLTRYLKNIRFAKILTILRVFRGSRIFRYSYKFEELSNFSYDSALAAIKLIVLILVLLLFCHISACMQFLVCVIQEFPNKSWVKLAGLHLDCKVSLTRQYMWAFFRAVSHMLCIGYGHIPQRDSEVFVVLCSMLCGAILFAIFIGIATSTIQGQDSSKRLYKEKYNSVLQYMQYRRFSKRLRWRITDYYENRYQGKMFDVKVILEELNPLLRKVVSNFNCRELVTAVPCFKNLDPQTIDSIVQNLRLELFLADDKIIEEGSRGEEMYFVYRGSVKAVSKHFGVSQMITEGHYFGELCLLLADLRRVASVYATTYTYVYALTRSDFNAVLENFPVERQNMLSHAVEHLQSRTLSRDEFGTNDIEIPIDDAPLLAQMADLTKETIQE